MSDIINITASCMKAVSVNYQSYQDYVVDSDAYIKLIISRAFQRLERG